MKKYLDGVLLVEGKEDASYLSNYIASEIVVINGFDIKDSLISYLKNKRVIILTDPDEAGLKIREKLNKKLSNVVNVEIDINKCSRGVKNGVAECQIDEIMDILSPFFIEDPQSDPLVTPNDLFVLGISENKNLRQFVCKELALGKCNNKTLLKRLNLNHIKVEELEKIVKKYQNGN